MALPRPLLLALLGAVLVGVAFIATRGAGDSASEETSTPAPDADVPQLKPTTPKPTTDVRKALAGAQPTTSGKFELRLSAENLAVTANGSFQSRGLDKLPLLRIDLTARNAGETLRVGAVSSGDKGYLLSGDKVLQVHPKGWAALAQVRADEAKAGRSQDDTQGFSAKELDSMKLIGQEQLDGVPVLHFRGAVDAKEARIDFKGMADVLDKTSLGSPLPRVLARSIQGGTGEIWVGVDDHVIRRTHVTFRSPRTPFELDLSRSNLGQPQKIAAPRNASTKSAADAGWNRDEFGLAFSSLVAGVFLVEASDNDRPEPVNQQPSERKPAERKPARRERERARPERRQARPDRRPARRAGTSPAAVRRAVRQRKVVVLFFRQAGADDDAVAAAVNGQRGRRGVAVFALRVGQAPKYSRFGGANVVRAPTIVVVGRDRTPRLYEGFIDPATLAQAVTDAR